jgi:hypothetical protein
MLTCGRLLQHGALLAVLGSGISSQPPQSCQWWQKTYHHFSYGGECLPHGSPCAGTAIPGDTMNNRCTVAFTCNRSISTRICAAQTDDCCVLTFPNASLVHIAGTTLEDTITKRPNCAVIDTDGLRPPYVNFGDDHQNQTYLNIDGKPLDATIHAYAVIPCKAVKTDTNPGGIPMGSTARIRNRRTGACVDGIIGDCGDSESDGCKIEGYGEMSMAATKAIGVYLGPEHASADPTEITFGVAPDPEQCKPAPPPPPPPLLPTLESKSPGRE